MRQESLRKSSGEGASGFENSECSRTDLSSGDDEMVSGKDCDLLRGAEIVRSDATGVTLRQLFYRLVAAQVLPK
jgi:hypothetical protein